MKTTKLVIGILMIILSFFIVFQSMAAGLLNTIENKGATSGSAGISMAIAYLVAGIVYLSTKNKDGLGGDIANAVILGLFGILGLTNVNKTFADLIVWIILGFIIGFGFLIWHLFVNRKNRQTPAPANHDNYRQTSQVNKTRQANISTQYPSRSQLHSRRHH